MLWGAIASFLLAAVMALLVGLGLAHARGTAPEAQMFRADGRGPRRPERRSGAGGVAMPWPTKAG